MISSIRKRHKIIWLISAGLLVLVFVAGLAFRHPEPINENIPKFVNGK